MAQLLVESDPIVPGRWRLRSSNPAALAATCDALVQVLELGSDALAAWALHNDEQQGMRGDAYHDELRELGPLAVAEVVELTRPWQPNVVWVDRFHLVVSAAQPASGSRLLGLYVGSPGRLVLSLHHPSVALQVQGVVRQLADDVGRDWDSPAHVQLARFVLHYDTAQPDAIDIRCPQPQAHAVQDAIGRLTQLVASW